MSTAPPPSETVVAVRTVGVRRSCPWVLALGILALIAGLITLLWPSVTVYALVFVLGVFLGVITVVWPSITILVVALVIGFMLLFWGAVLTRFASVLRRQPAA